MIWIRFAISAIVIVAGGIMAAEFGDIIALRTRLGRPLFGTIVLAFANTLPEFIAAFSAVRLGVPDLAVGGMLGNLMIYVLIIGILDLFSRQRRLLHQVAITHSLTAALTTLMTGIVVFFVVVPLGGLWGRIHLDSAILLLVFLGGARLIQLGAGPRPATAETVTPAPRFSLRQAIVGFVVAAVLLVVASPVLVEAVEEIAARTGLAVGFFGVALFPLVTAIPEVASSTTAVRIGAFDLAVGNLFGSCVFDLAFLALVGLFHPPGSIFAAVSPGFAVVGLLGLVLINVALLGSLTEVEWRVLGIEWDALIIIVVYFAGLYFLYSQGLLVAPAR